MPANDPIVFTSDLDQFQAGDAQAALEDWTAEVRGFCGWHVTPSVTETITVDGSGRGLIMLPSLHVTAVTSVTEDGVALLPADYTWNAAGCLARVGTRFWSTAASSVTVTFTHGHASAPDLARVIKAAATRGQDSPNGSFIRQVGLVAFQAPKSDGFLESELAVLNRYRIPATP